MSSQSNRLEEIKDEIKDLLEESRRIIHFNGNKLDWERAKSYWFAHIQCALDKNNDYLGSSMFTMQDTIDSLSDEDEDEETGESWA